MPNTSPSTTPNDMPSTAVRLPYRLVRLSTAITVSRAPPGAGAGQVVEEFGCGVIIIP